MDVTTTDIISSIFDFIGLRIARKPADENHYFGHSNLNPWPASPPLSSCLVVQVIKSSAERFIAQDYPTPDLQALWVDWLPVSFTRHLALHPLLAQQTQSMSLKAQCQGSLQ